MKSLPVKTSAKSLTVVKTKYLVVTKKVATKMLLISSKALFATFVLTFVNLFV